MFDFGKNESPTAACERRQGRARASVQQVWNSVSLFCLLLSLSSFPVPPSLLEWNGMDEKVVIDTQTRPSFPVTVNAKQRKGAVVRKTHKTSQEPPRVMGVFMCVYFVFHLFWIPAYLPLSVHAKHVGRIKRGHHRREYFLYDTICEYHHTIPVGCDIIR